MQDTIAIPLIPDSAKADSIAPAGTENSFAALTDSSFISADTIIQPIRNPEPALVDTLFKSHQLQFNRYYPKTLDKATPDWFTVLLLMIVITVTLIKVFYSRILFQIFRAFINNNTANQIIRDENILVQRASVLLSVICYAVLALFVYKISDYFNYQSDFIGTGFVKFLFISLFIALGYSLKMIVLKMLGFIFNFEKPVAAYIFNLFLINNVLGMLLLPILITITYFNVQYVGYLLITSIILVGLFYLYRLIKGIVIWLNAGHPNLFYLFLYICALEITPILIIFKVLSI